MTITCALICVILIAARFYLLRQAIVRLAMKKYPTFSAVLRDISSTTWSIASLIILCIALGIFIAEIANRVISSM